MSQELVGRLDEVLALIEYGDGNGPGWLVASRDGEIGAVDFLRTHGQQIRQAIAGAEVAGGWGELA